MNFKFPFFVILSFIISAILIISSFIVFNKAHNTISLVDSNIHLKSHHSSLSDRITKFYHLFFYSSILLLSIIRIREVEFIYFEF